MVAYCYFENKNHGNEKSRTNDGVFSRTVAGKERDCYLCDLQIDENGGLVARVYTDITNEFGSTKFREGMKLEPRDVFIVDVERAFLLKNATFLACYNLNDNSFIKDFFNISASEYFTASKDQEQGLFEFFEKKSEPKVESIRIFSNDLLNPARAPLFKLIDKNGNGNKEISIDGNEIVSKISSFGDYKPQQVGDLGDLTLVKCDSGIEIHFKEAVEYFRINYYLMEIMLYFQLFAPDSIDIQKVEAKVGKEYYQFSTAKNWNFEKILNCRYQLAQSKCRNFSVSVNDESILNFLKKCYEKISCQRDVAHVFNLRCLVFLYHRILEDVFMNYFRLIELFFKEKIRLLDEKSNKGEKLTYEEEKVLKNIRVYSKDKKKKSVKNPRGGSKDKKKVPLEINKISSKPAIRWAIERSWAKIQENFPKGVKDLKNSKLKDYVGDLAHKIVKSRNHYVHHGYYIPDKGIEYGEKNGQKYYQPITVDEIIETFDKVLFPIATDIIFKDILGYEHYEFPSPLKF